VEVLPLDVEVEVEVWELVLETVPVEPFDASAESAGRPG